MQKYRELFQVVITFVIGGCLWLTGCSDSLTLYEPVTVCHCSSDQFCVGEQCVSLGNTVLTEVRVEAEAVPVPTCNAQAVRIEELGVAFVELKGPAEVALQGYRLRLSNGEGVRLFEWSLLGSTDEAGFWVGGFAATVGADAMLGQLTLPPSATLELFDCAGKRRDALSYGLESSSLGKGDPVVEQLEGEVVFGRCPNSEDRGDNRRDFVVSTLASAGQENDPLRQLPLCVLCSDTSRAWLTEWDYRSGVVELRADGAVAVWLEQWVDGAWVQQASQQVEAAGRWTMAEVTSAEEGGALRLIGCEATLLDALGYGLIEGAGVDAVPAVAAEQSLTRCPDAPTLPLESTWLAASPTLGEDNLCE